MVLGAKHGDVLAVIVSFNGMHKTVDVINSLFGKVKYVLIVDNCSESQSFSLLKIREQNSEYMVMRLAQNMGIGYALNIAVMKAKELNCEWVLTMDQDSRPDHRMLEEFWNVIALKPSLACLTPNIFLNASSSCDVLREGRVEFAITSGNLVRIDVYDCIGLYNEDLFIDGVDIDFSLRVRLAGFDIWCAKNAILSHELGDTVKGRKYLCKYYTSHSPLRRYYMYRNHLYIMRKYVMKYPWFICKASIYQVIHFFTILVYGPERFQSVVFIIRGVFDYFMGRIGPYGNER